MSESITVLLVDDHPLVRSALRSMLEATGGFEIVGEAHDGHEAVAKAVETHPHVVVMDLGLPGMSGLDATRLILQQVDGTAVLVLTALEDDDAVFEAVRAGARGYTVKAAPPADLIDAIRAVARGDTLFGAAVADRIVAHLQRNRTDVGRLEELTVRERDVLRLVGTGLRNPEIAARLGMQPKTVRNHVSNILTKLQVADRTGAVLRAREAGLAQSTWHTRDP